MRQNKALTESSTIIRMMCDDPLTIAKKKLDLSLGDHFKKYLNLCRLWFTSQLTKEDFDRRAREFLSLESVTCHNEFLLALLNKCTSLTPPKEPSRSATAGHTSSTGIEDSSQTLPELNRAKVSRDKVTDPKPLGLKKCLKSSNSSLKARINKFKVSFDRRFEPVSVHDNGYSSYTGNVKAMDDTGKILNASPGFCARESALPDYFMSHLRMFVLIWELGLETVDDNAIKLIITALRDFMKSLLTSIFNCRSSYRLRDCRFRYATGAPPVNPYLKNSSNLLSNENDHILTVDTETGDHQSTLKPTIDLAVNDAMYSMACGLSSCVTRVKRSRGEHHNGPVTMWHLLHTLKYDRNAIPMHSVYAVNLEKVILKLWHQCDDTTKDTKIVNVFQT